LETISDPWGKGVVHTAIRDIEESEAWRRHGNEEIADASLWFAEQGLARIDRLVEKYGPRFQAIGG
jgi:hypothetical protein